MLQLVELYFFEYDITKINVLQVLPIVIRYHNCYSNQWTPPLFPIDNLPSVLSLKPQDRYDTKE